MSSRHRHLTVTLAMSAISAIILALTVVGACALVPSPALPPCAAEDSDNCFWDATVRGNGEGRSFVSLDGVVYLAE